MGGQLGAFLGSMLGAISTPYGLIFSLGTFIAAALPSSWLWRLLVILVATVGFPLSRYWMQTSYGSAEGAAWMASHSIPPAIGMGIVAAIAIGTRVARDKARRRA